MLNATATTQDVPPPAAIGVVGGLVVGVLLLASFAALISVWQRPGKLAGRVIWSLVVLVPFLGPLVYAAIVIMYPRTPTPVSAPVNVNVMQSRDGQGERGR